MSITINENNLWNDLWNDFTKRFNKQQQQEEDKQFSVNDLNDQKLIFDDIIEQKIPYNCVILGLFQPAQNVQSLYSAHKLKCPEWFDLKYGSLIKSKYKMTDNKSYLCECQVKVDNNSFSD